MMIRSILAIILGSMFLSVADAEPTVTYILESETRLSNPHDIKLSPDGKYLYVSDVNNNQVVILDPETLEYISAFGSDHQHGTHDVDVDSLGRIYVADTHNHRIAIYELQDTIPRLVDELNQGIRAPEGVLVHDNGRVYATGAGSGNVVAYENGRSIRSNWKSGMRWCRWWMRSRTAICCSGSP